METARNRSETPYVVSYNGLRGLRHWPWKWSLMGETISRLEIGFAGKVNDCLHRCARSAVGVRAGMILSSLRDWFRYIPQPTVYTVGYYRSSLTGLQTTALAASELSPR